MSAPFKRVLVIDFETAWSKKEYTLSLMTTESYIRDPRFKAWGCAYKYLDEDTEPVWIPGDQLQRFFDGIDWSTTAILAHNAQFDGSILHWKYGHLPCFIFDSLSMARGLYGTDVGNSLAKLAARFDLPPKGDAIHSSDGYLDELPMAVHEELADYCCHDTWLCAQIFSRMIDEYPKKELRLIDLTLRMYIDPQLKLDPYMLKEAIEEEKERREGLLKRIAVPEEDLASNPKFAEVLRVMGVEPPTKVSKTTGEITYAFAKNDALFQALLQHDSEDIVTLCEARLKVKSTLERTRAQRFLDIAGRGALPVPLDYYKAHTGRWAASKGSGLNLQNLGRGSFLRKAIMSPEGYSLVACDLSQIEPRVLAWLANYRELLNIFASGQDAYAAFGAQMFGIPGLTKESHPALRQSAKSALLGCFGPATEVLTDSGWKAIVSVQLTDLVWDGEEWVQHQGVIPQGEKEVLTAHGVSATSDHEILTERGWVEWQEALTNPSLIQQALRLARLPSSAGSVEAELPKQETNTNTNRGAAVRAGGKVSSTEPICGVGVLRDAVRAQRKKLRRLWQSVGGLKPCALTTQKGSACSTASAPSSCAALIRTAKPTQTTAVAGLLYTPLGLPVAWSFYSIYAPFRAATKKHSSLTESTTARGTFREIFAFAHAAKTWLINGASRREKSKLCDSVSPPLKQRMQTYDIAYAGPRNRYTVRTTHGPMLVHNCGYGLGWQSFAAQLLTGFLGAPPLRYDMAFAKQLGVTKDMLVAFINDEKLMSKALSIPRTCSEEEIVLHCVAAKSIIERYRSTAKPVQELWDLCDDALRRCLAGGKEFRHKCVAFEKERILLPSGMYLRYPDLRSVKDPSFRSRVQWLYNNKTKIYGSKVVENIVQAVARCVMSDGMLRIQRRYKCVLTVHDEVVVLVPDDELDEAASWIKEQMVVEPSYMPGLPLDASIGIGKRYGEAK